MYTHVHSIKLDGGKVDLSPKAQEKNFKLGSLRESKLNPLNYKQNT